MNMSKRTTFTILKQTNQRYTVFNPDDNSYRSGLTESEMVNFAMNYLPFASIDDLFKEFDKYFKYYQEFSCSELFSHQILKTHSNLSLDEQSQMITSMILSDEELDVFNESPVIYKFPYFKGNNWFIFNELTGRDDHSDLTESQAFNKFIDMYNDVFSERYLTDYFNHKVLKDADSNLFRVDYRKKQTEGVVYNI